MKHLMFTWALFMSMSLLASDGLISRGGGGHGGGHGVGGHAGGADFNRGGGEFNRGYNHGYDHGRNWDYGGDGWGGYDGYILPAPTSSYDPLQDPNDDMNQIYQQNLRNMERTGQ